MKKILLIIAVAITFQVKGQNIVNHSPAGFDTPRNEIKKGKIDTIIYYSKTVGTKRKALVYTPPSYTKTRKYPVLYLLHGIGGDEKEWLKGIQPQVILMLSKFDELKIKYIYSEYPGGHTWLVWRNNLFNFTQLLFK